MSQDQQPMDLKAINALKKKINWGQVPAQYHMVATSAGELDGILSHGFESGFTQLLEPKNWNQKLLGATESATGEITFSHKPHISLRHVYTDMGYELHCYPIVGEERLNHTLIDHPACPFNTWTPESMRRLFRVNHLGPFIIQTVQKGDDADKELVRHIYQRVNELIEFLSQRMDVDEVRGYSIAEFVQEVRKKSGQLDTFDQF